LVQTHYCNDCNVRSGHALVVLVQVINRCCYIMCRLDTKEYRRARHDLHLRKFSDMICVKRDERKWCDGQRSSCTAVVGVGWLEIYIEPHIRLWNEDGSTSTREPTTRQTETGPRTGNAITANCFLYGKYVKEDGTTAYNTTS
jgi:hypothetical protein